MKIIGLIGGMSWESSIEYYRIINEVTKERLGGLHSAKSVMVSVDFAEIEEMQMRGDWQQAGQAMAAAAKSLENGGADFMVLCTNTMHKLADEMQAAVQIPMLHIADATAERIKANGIKTIGLLGTRFTMEQDFYKGRLEDRFGLNVLIPDEVGRGVVHGVIYNELVKGVIRDESKRQYIRIIEELIQAGSQGIILGCTEIGLLVQDGDCEVPFFDTTRIHAEAAVEFALND
ncbi:MAG: aspartate/glutamate racemase family protein [Anaerolineaceae bacterium]|nr:aspartate/glutamate racemase family protein [Anaerolineaceae bacterium]